MALVYLGLGTNLGDKEYNLNDTILKLSHEVGKIVCQSGNYVSKPWGFESENEFLNVVVSLETDLSPFDLLASTQEIERIIGRTAKSANGYVDRVIDIDILLYDKEIVDTPELKIPHPLMTKRDFVLKPLAEIVPDLVHPVLEKKIAELLNKLIQ
jgi:2-amino-4-hydroxy-6-hydroxymethyldihydropteridine diphosphokinase